MAVDVRGRTIERVENLFNYLRVPGGCPPGLAGLIANIAQVIAADVWEDGHRTPWVPDESVEPCECYAHSWGECACGRYGAKKMAPNPHRD